MSTSNTPWDDTGFDEEASGGFKSSPPKVEPPQAPVPLVETPQAHVPVVEPPQAPAPVVEPPRPQPSQYTRVEPAANVPPPEPERRSRWGMIFLIAALFLIVTSLGYIVSTLFMRDPTEQEAFFDGNAESQEIAVAPVDTVAVALPPVEEPVANSNVVDSSPRQITSAVRLRKTPPDEAPERPSPPPDVKSPPANALYVVQVFSSPSRDDADEWLQILRERKVPDGFITEQRLGGESWYRVRFGQYSTRQDAEAAAQQLGFANPWIARVR